jgi:hypothetical protein
MHNEDNKLGITVTNKKGQEFSIWGDKQLFEPQNKTNLEMMRQGLQASVNEVWEAFDSKNAKRPSDGYRAWDYAPHATVEGKSHYPLFKDLKLNWWNVLDWPVQVREPFSNPKSNNYRPVGDSASLIELYNKIKDSEQWKKY